jgi:hypothetical protein
MKATFATAIAILLLLACAGDGTSPDPSPAKLVLSISDTTLLIGEYGQAKVVVLDKGNRVIDGVVVVWQSSDGSVLEVSGSGRVKGMSAGTAEVRVTARNLQASLPVTVGEPAPSISIQASPGMGYVGDTVALTWAATWARECMASGAWSGVRPSSGATSLVIDTATTRDYRLTCTGAGGESYATARVIGNVLQDATCSAQRLEEAGMPGGPVRMGEYVPVNNYGSDIWALYPGFSACMTAARPTLEFITAEWTWSIPWGPQPDSTRRPLGAPGINFGGALLEWAPTFRTTNRLPVPVSSAPSLMVDFDLRLAYDDSAQLNTLLDIWIGDPASPFRRQIEVMVITTLVRVPISHEGHETATIGGREYWVPSWGYLSPHPWYPTDPGSHIGLIQLHAKEPFLSGTIPVREILTYLLSRGWIEPTHLLTFISFGIEPNAGSGTATLRSFRIQDR